MLKKYFSTYLELAFAFDKENLVSLGMFKTVAHFNMVLHLFMAYKVFGF